MGLCASQPVKPEEQHPAVATDWALKGEAIRIFKLADLDADGGLNLTELKRALKSPQFAEQAMENMDQDKDGKVSLSEWLVALKSTFDKSEAACRTALKTHEKMIDMNREKETEA